MRKMPACRKKTNKRYASEITSIFFSLTLFQHIYTNTVSQSQAKAKAKAI